MVVTVEWQRKPNMIMARAGVRMVPKMMLASPPLISAMIIFCAVTSTEHAQQSREPLNSSGLSAVSLPPREYGGGTTAPEPTLGGEPSSEWACSVFSSVPFRDRLIFACEKEMVTLFVVLTVLYPEDVSSCGSMVAADDEILKDLESVPCPLFS
ncbi:hypothetical protein EYF80_003022 [Liparis tanakae]|uniref:Uncharacterized protein n=1 Tax=Liparis tanakae TaxID=230148 RepID=A0A4Z2J9E8_9TELE|nr:hypothetical protein EYF80_003022 [Liparis tanakae]